MTPLGITRSVALTTTLGLLVALSSAGCKREKGEGLPAGSALPAPQVPKLEAVAEPMASNAKETSAAAGDLVGTGTLQAKDEAQLGPKATGTLAEVKVDEGDVVKKGQLLFRIDASQSSIMVQQAKATLSSAEIAYGAAELDFKRTKELFDRGSVAAATFDQVKARYDGAKAGVEQAKAALAAAQKSVGDTAVYSPINGVVTARYKNVGETVTMMPPTTVLVVQDVKRLELRARLPERALAKLDVGTNIHASFPAIGKSRDVAVTRINPALDARTRTVEVVADVDNSDGTLKSGMLAEITIGGDAGAVSAGSPAAHTASTGDGHGVTPSSTTSPTKTVGSARVP